MAGLTIDKAMRHLKRKLDRTAARQVTIIADNESCEGLDAVPVTANFAELLAGEYAVSAQRFDWIVEADKLRFAGEKREPKPGWEIRLALDDGRTAVYRLFAEDGGRCFEVEDALGILLNLHTKLERVETPE